MEKNDKLDDPEILDVSSPDLCRLFERLLARGKAVRFSVTGPSMAPLVKSGDYVTVVPANGEDVCLGDLVLFRQYGECMVLHRVLWVFRDSGGRTKRLITKGDAVDTPDPPVSAADILGRVVLIERILPSGMKRRRLDGYVPVLCSRVMALFHLARSMAVRLGCGRVCDLPFAKSSFYKKRHILYMIDRMPSGLEPAQDFCLSESMEAVFRENLQGLMFVAARRCRKPAGTLKSLENAYFTCLAENVRRLEAIKRIEPFLEARGGCAMVFKGAALIGSAYDDPGLRPMEDIDLMAQPGREEALCRALLDAGFVRHYRFPALFEKDCVRIDVHVHPLNADRVAARAGLLGFGSKSVFERSIPFQPGMKRIRKPSDIDHIFILIQHMVKHSFAKLVWLEDVRRILRHKDTRFLIELNRAICAYGQQRPMAYVSYLAGNIYGIPLYPANSFISPPTLSLTRIEKALLDLRVSGRSMGDLGNLLWLFCLPDRRIAFRFAVQTLFPVVSPRKQMQAGPKTVLEKRACLPRIILVLKRLAKGLPVLLKALFIRPR